MHPDIGGELVIYVPGADSMEVTNRRTADRRRLQEAEMLWKIIGVVAVVWIALTLVGALIKGLFPILVISVVVFGLYLLYKAISGSDNSSVTKL